MRKNMFRKLLMLLTVLAVSLHGTAALAASAVNIPPVEQRSLEIDPISPRSQTAENAEFLAWDGEITADDQADVYMFTARNSGTYRAELSGLKNGIAVELRILDENGEVITRNSYCTNREGATVPDLKAGCTYQIEVRQKESRGVYRLMLGMAKAETDISELTELKDSIEFTDQRNVYWFSVPRSGRYRFEFSRMMKGTAVQIRLYNDLEETVASDGYCTNGDGITVSDLKVGEVYRIEVIQAGDMGNYILSIGQQKDSVDISELTRVTDSMEYTDQRNVYWFAVPRDGRYRFGFSRMMKGFAVEVRVYNDLEEIVVSDGYCTNEDGVTLLEAKAGELYRIEVTQLDGTGSYILSVGPQKETVLIGRQTVVRDSIEYTDQCNVYELTADSAGEVRLTAEGMENGFAVELVVVNDLGEVITSDGYCANGDTLTVAGLSAGETVVILVRQLDRTGEYTLTVE